MYRSKSMDFGSLLQKWQVKGDDEGTSEKKTPTKSNGASQIGRFVVPKSTRDLRERFQSPGIGSPKDRANGGLSRNEDFKLNLKYKSTTDLREKFKNTAEEVPKGRNNEYKRTYKINGSDHGFEAVRLRDAPQLKVHVRKDRLEKEADSEPRSWRDEPFGKRNIPKTHSNGDPPQVSRPWSRNVAQKEENKSDPFDTKRRLHSVGDLDRNTEPEHVFRRKYVEGYVEKSETDDKVISTPPNRDDRQQVNKVNGNVESSSEAESEESLHKIVVNPAELSRKKTMELNGDRLGQKSWDNWKGNKTEDTTTFPKTSIHMSANLDTSENDKPTNRSANFRAKWQSKFKDLYGDSGDDAFNVFSPKVKQSTGKDTFSAKIEDDTCKWSTDKGNEEPLNVIPSKVKQSATKETFSKKIEDDMCEWSTSKGYDGVDSIILPKVKQLPAEDSMKSAKIKNDDKLSMGNDNAKKTTNHGEKTNGFGIDTDIEKDDIKDIKDKMKQRRQFWVSDDKKKNDTTTASKESNGGELQNKLESRRNGGNVLESGWKEPERNTLVTKQRTVPKITGLNSAAKKWKEREQENLQQSSVQVSKENHSLKKSSHDHGKYNADKARYKNTQSTSMRPKADNNFAEKSSEDGSTYDSESGSDFGTSGRSSETPITESKEIPINKVEYFETVGGNIDTKETKSGLAESTTATYEEKPSIVSVSKIEKQTVETSKHPPGNVIA